MSWKRFIWAVVILVLAALVGLLLYIRAQNSLTIQEAASQKQVIRSVVVQMMDSRDDLVVESLVVGTQVEPGFFDFRGAVKAGTTSVPLYGMIELRCSQLSVDPECWTLVLLERDGEAWPPEPLPDAETVTLEIGDDLNLEDTFDNESVTQPDLADAEPDLDTADDVSADSTLEDVVADPVYQVINDNVNGRAGPGTDHEVVASITPERRLILLESGTEWGRFRFQNPAEGESSEFWVWLGLLTPVSQTP